MFNARLAIHKAYESTLRDLYGRDVLETKVPLATDFKEAIARRAPIVHCKPRGNAAKAIKALAEELRSRASYTVQTEDSDAKNQEASYTVHTEDSDTDQQEAAA